MPTKPNTTRRKPILTIRPGRQLPEAEQTAEAIKALGRAQKAVDAARQHLTPTAAGLGGGDLLGAIASQLGGLRENLAEGKKVLRGRRVVDKADDEG